VLTDAGDRGVRIPAGIGRGWCNEAGGSARYHCYVPADGRYTLWAYCLWGGVCTNAVYAQIDTSAKAVLGNDPLYDRWHWVRGVAWPLSRGTHILTLSNHSDGIAVQRLLLLSDPLDQPGDGSLAFYDLFYDGFDGCAGGNITAWSLSSGKQWQLIEPAGMRGYENRILAGASPASGPPIAAVIGEDTWRDYAVNLRVRMVSPGRMAIACDYQGPDECLVAEWSLHGPEERSVKVQIARRAIGRPMLLGEIEAPLRLNRWQDVGLIADGGELQFYLDGVLAGRIPFKDAVRGKLALLLSDGASAWFDDVHVRLADAASLKLGHEDSTRKGAGCAANRCKR